VRDQLGTEQNTKVGKISCPIVSRLWTKVHEILARCRGSYVLSNALADCLCHVSFRRYSPLSLEVIEKPSKCKSFGPQFLGREDPDFSTAGC